MRRRDNRDIVGRINKRLKSLKKSARAASLEAGLGADVIRDLGRNPDVIPRLDTIEALAPVLQMPPEELAFGTRKRPRRGQAPERLKIVGEVAAGLWLDLGFAEDREYEQYPVPFHPSYPEEAQYGLIVLGTSINKTAQNGDVLQCLDIAMSRAKPQDNDLVIVERRRAQAGQKEVTAKRYRPKGRVIELAPDSTDSRWREPFVIDPKIPASDEEIAVVAIVIGVYKPLRR